MNKIAFFALMLALGLVGGCGNKKEEKKKKKKIWPGSARNRTKSR